MFNSFNYNDNLEVAYNELVENTNALISIENVKSANYANAIAMLNYFLTDINWVGLYFVELETNDLVLSHFNGLPACARLRYNIGVCQHAVTTKETVVVDDVNSFENHIACDSASKSEIVIPLFDQNNNVVAVLDIDSPLYSRFNKYDEKGLKLFCTNILERIYNE